MQGNISISNFYLYIPKYNVHLNLYSCLHDYKLSIGSGLKCNHIRGLVLVSGFLLIIIPSKPSCFVLLVINNVLLCTMFRVKVTVYGVWCTYSVQCTYTMCNVQCTIYNLECTMYNVQCTMYHLQFFAMCNL
jgi:hypothetical protein